MKYTILLLLAALTSCAPSRKPVQVGDIPNSSAVSYEDEEYGQAVLDQLTQQAPLDRNDANINRVEDIVDRLTRAANADQSPWHIYVLNDGKVKNAAATRGNYVFVWTGILSAVRNDSELAGILAHEIGHVLAKHTTPDPAEEANQMITGVTGSIAREILSSQSGAIGIVGGIAESLITASMNALIVNPNSQRLEYEADQIGIFLMADAGYDPRSFVDFWERARNDPDFSGSDIQFLSTHPSTGNRLERLRKMLPESIARYERTRDGRPKVERNRSIRRNNTRRNNWDSNSYFDR